MRLPTHRDRTELSWKSSTPFVIAQFIPLLAVFTGVTTKALVLGLVLYWTRVFCITGGYHRYFSHRTYRTNRVVQFLLAYGGVAAAQKGPLWWAANHRRHHKYADTDRDPHSPQKGFWWAHIGWVLSSEYNETHFDEIEDFARYPELRFLNRYDWIGPWSLGIFSFLVAGWSGLVVGFFGSTLLLWHATFSVNSVAHVWGWRRFGTADSSRNNPIVAFLTMGEGWHNNHHHHPNCARQGFKWWEIDASYMVLRAMAAVGLVHDLRKPVPAALSSRRLADGTIDIGRLRQHLSRAASAVGEHADVMARLDSAVEAVNRERARLGATSAQVPISS